MRHTSGYYVNFTGHDITNEYPTQAVTVCQQWCQQLYAICKEGKGKNSPEAQAPITSDALNYCTSTVGVEVDMSPHSDFCFNSAFNTQGRGHLMLAGLLTIGIGAAVI